MIDRRTTGFGADGLVMSRWPELASVAQKPVLEGPRYQFVSWLVLVGLVIPAWEAQISIAGAKFTAGRMAVTVLVIPAIIVLARRGRHLVTCDVAVLLAAIWMLVAASATGGFG